MKRMKRAISIITIILALGFAGQVWGQGVKTGDLNLGVNGGSDADGSVTIDRTGSNMRFTDGSGVFLLSELGVSGTTSRTAIVTQSGFQGPTFVVLGDSNVRFGNADGGERNIWGAWPHQAEIMTQSNPLLWGTNIHNHGISGLDSSSAIAALDAAMKHDGADGDTDPDFVIIQIGGNDLLIASPISTTDMIDNITTMTNDIVSSGSIPIIINVMDMEFGPFVDNGAITNDQELDDTIAQYNTALKNFAEQNEFAFFDLNSLMMTADTDNRWYVFQNFPAGGGRLHFSFAGQRRLAVHMLNFLYDKGMIAGNDLATNVETIRYDDSRVVFRNQASLSDSSNQKFTLIDTTEYFGAFDYRLQENDTAPDKEILRFDFTGSGIALVTATGEFGLIEVTLDGGTPEEIDLWRDQGSAGTTLDTEAVFSDIPWYQRELDYSTHTLEVTLKSTNGTSGTTFQAWIQGVLVEHHAMESDFDIADGMTTATNGSATTITAPAMVLAAPAIQEWISDNIFEATGNGTQGFVINDLDFSITDDSGDNLITTDDSARQVGIGTSTMEADIHMHVTDRSLIRSDSVDALVAILQLTRDDWDDGDVLGLFAAESESGVLTSDFFGAIGFHAVSATAGDIDGEIIFSVGDDNVLDPVAWLDTKTSRFEKPLWIEKNDSARTSPTQMIAWFEDGSSSANIYVTTPNNAAGSLFFGDANADAQGGISYNHNNDTLVLSANATEFIFIGDDLSGFTEGILLIDSNVTTITYGDSAVVPTAATKLLIEDSTGNDVHLTLGTDNDDKSGLLFADDGDNDVGKIEYDHDAETLTFTQNGTDAFVIRTVATEFNDTEADKDFIVNGDSISNVFFVQASDGHIGVNDATPSQTFQITQVDTSGQGLQVYRDLASANTDNSLCSIFQDNAGDDQVALAVRNDGSGNAIRATGTVYVNGFTAIGDDSTALAMLHVEDTAFAGSVGIFINSGNSANNEGVSIQAGLSTPTSTDECVLVRFFTGNEGDAGFIGFDGADPDFVSPVSDARLKKNKRKTRILNKDRARSVVKNVFLKDYQFNFGDTETTRTGYVAQDLLEYYPEMVVWIEKMEETTKTALLIDGGTTQTIVLEDHGNYGVVKGKMVDVLFQETKRQQREIELLWAALAALSAVVLGLIGQVRKIAKKVGMPVADLDALKNLEDQIKELQNEQPIE